MTQVFKNTEWTDFLWGDHTRFDENAREAVREGVKTVAEAFEDFGNETFARFYGNPEKKEAVEGAEWAEKLHKCMEEVPEFQNLCEFCKGSDWKAGVSSAAMIKELLSKITPPEKPFEDVQAAQNVADYLKQLLEDDEISDEERTNLEKTLEEAQEAVQEKAQANEDASKLLDGTEIRNAVRKASKDAQAGIYEVENMLAGLGCGMGQHENVKGNLSAKQLLDTVKANPKLSEILKIAGRLKRVAQQKQKAKPKKGTNEFTGVLSGDDLSRTLPCETMLLMDPELELIFGRKHQERALLEYELREKPEEEQGPIVMLVDCSGSMSYQSRDVWASAVTLAFLSVAREQKRDFAVVHFSYDIRKVTLFEGKAKVDMDAMLQAVTACGPSGGTSFEKPLNEAMQVINTMGAFKKADIIMVSDGDAPTSDEFLTRFHMDKKLYEVSCYTVLVGDEGNKDSALRFSDEVVMLKDVMKDEAKMHGLFGEV